MKLPNVHGMMTVGKTFLSAHRPEILFATSVVTTIGATVLAAKGGYEARGIVENARDERHDVVGSTDRPDLTKREIANLTWHCYLPAAGLALTSVASTTGLHLVHVRDKKALATMALAAVEEIKSEAKEYVAELEDVIDPDGDGVCDMRALNEAGDDPIVDEMYLVRDGRTGRDFWSNKLKIENAIVECKNVIAGGGGAEGEGDCDLGFFYSHAGIKGTPDAYKRGWSGVLPEVKWSEETRADGRTVAMFSFRPEPTLERGRD